MSLHWSDERAFKQAGKLDVYLRDLRETKETTAARVLRVVVTFVLALAAGAVALTGAVLLGCIILGAALLVALGAFTMKNGNHNGAHALNGGNK